VREAVHARPPTARNIASGRCTTREESTIKELHSFVGIHFSLGPCISCARCPPDRWTWRPDLINMQHLSLALPLELDDDERPRLELLEGTCSSGETSTSPGLFPLPHALLVQVLAYLTRYRDLARVHLVRPRPTCADGGAAKLLRQASCGCACVCVTRVTAPRARVWMVSSTALRGRKCSTASSGRVRQLVSYTRASVWSVSDQHHRLTSRHTPRRALATAAAWTHEAPPRSGVQPLERTSNMAGLTLVSLRCIRVACWTPSCASVVISSTSRHVRHGAGQHQKFMHPRRG
jgi:hypothetical protein